MNEFQMICKYISNHPNVFSNLEDAKVAYLLHKSREEAKDDSNDMLKQFHKAYINKAKWDRQAKKWRRISFQSWYNFSEIRGFLKKRGLYGTQIFDSRNVLGDEMRTIYDKDGVTIDYCYGYEYLEVFGLNACDFKFLEKLHKDWMKSIWQES